jgi:hypothetical protein
MTSFESLALPADGACGVAPGARLSICLVRASASAAPIVASTLRPVATVFESVGGALDLRSAWGMSAQLAVAATIGGAALPRLAGAVELVGEQARCLALEVCSEGTATVLGDARFDPIGTCLWAQSCMRLHDAADAESLGLVRTVIRQHRQRGWRAVQVGSELLVSRWDDLMLPSGRMDARSAAGLVKFLVGFGLRGTASVVHLDGDWTGASLRSARIERLEAGRKTESSVACPGPGAGPWPGDAEPIQISMNLDGQGDRSVVVGARTWSALECSAGVARLESKGARAA